MNVDETDHLPTQVDLCVLGKTKRLSLNQRVGQTVKLSNNRNRLLKKSNDSSS